MKHANAVAERAVKVAGQADIEDAAHLGPHPENVKAAEEKMAIAADRLRSIVERIERLEGEKKDLASDIKDIFTEAKSAGFDGKAIRSVLKIRKQEPADVEAQETLIDVYRRALGM